MKVPTLIAVSLAVLGATPALAQNGYYVATPKVQIAKTSFVTRSALWKCADSVCAASRVAERDAVLCEILARRVGGLTAFSVGGAAYGTESLARCNTKVK